MSNPAEFGELVTNRFQELGYPDLALRTQMQIQQMMPEQAERKPTTFYNPDTQEYVRGFTSRGTAFSETGERLGEGFVERKFEEPEQTEEFVPLTPEQKTALNLDPNKFAQRNTVTGRVHTSGGQTINVGGEQDPAYEALTDQFKSDLERASKSASQATGLLQEVDRATTILSDPGFNTGAARPVLTNLRALAEDLGVSVDPALEAAGVEDLGQVSSAEAFRAFSANLTTRLAERLPGNLNQQEINLISTASSNLGKTPEANAEALASFRAAAELAQQRASSLTRAASQGTDAFIEEQKRQREVGIDRFRRLTERYKQRILEERGASTERVGGEIDFSNPRQLTDEQLRSLSERARQGELTTEQLQVLAEEWDRRGF
jgi:hypothetical protein